MFIQLYCELCISVLRDRVEPNGSDLSIFTNEVHVIMNFK